MKKDPIVEEIHKVRESRARRLKYDLEAIFNDLKARLLNNRNLSKAKPVKPQAFKVAESPAQYKAGRVK